uniref:Uncharacterized protein n=1 Tax=Siphoviridae sp. ctTDf8 TaxID=2825517 RepID=A0A8S5UJI3_9CAUD|nr:MAG TPA: hypothetical protein [Siphoviridae sp. ctTDf8]DAR00831.1 MAG TPA: hypothetical protein [Caudoviricetes sp.]
MVKAIRLFNLLNETAVPDLSFLYKNGFAT